MCGPVLCQGLLEFIYKFPCSAGGDYRKFSPATTSGAQSELTKLHRCIYANVKRQEFKSGKPCKILIQNDQTKFVEERAA